MFSSKDTPTDLFSFSFKRDKIFLPLFAFKDFDYRYSILMANEAYWLSHAEDA